MKIDIGNRWVWVTGASSGIGAEVAKEAARRGGRLILSGRRVEALEAVRGECERISREGGRAGGHEILAFDLADPEARDAALGELVSRSGGLALIVLNAGISQRGSFLELSPEAFRKVMDLDFFVPVEILRRLIPSLGGSSPAGIVLVSSIAGLIGAPRRSAYSAAKHALAGLGAVLRGELLERRIAVTTIFPGYVRTGIAEAAVGSDGRKDPDIENGADPAEVGRRIVAAALSGKAELKVAVSLEAWAGLFLTRHWPSLYARLAAGKGRRMSRRSGT